MSGVTGMRVVMGLQPTLLRARTATQYVVPSTSPVIVHDVTGVATEHSLTNNPPDSASYARASYCVTAAPPSETGAAQDTTADPPPGATPTDCGTPGTLTTYVNAAGNVPDPAGVVTETSTTPATPAGATADTDVSETTTKLAAGVAPKLTPVAPARPLPLIVTVVPPEAPPVAGDTDVTTGAGTTGVTATRALNGPHPTAFRARTAT
jgi:hypothetical protein